MSLLLGAGDACLNTQATEQDKYSSLLGSDFSTRESLRIAFKFVFKHIYIQDSVIEKFDGM